VNEYQTGDLPPSRYSINEATLALSRADGIAAANAKIAADAPAERAAAEREQ
jgi:hypothetical protein